MSPGHDYSLFYHCDCLDDDEHAEHDNERFYHCSCIEDGFDPEPIDDGSDLSMPFDDGADL